MPLSLLPFLPLPQSFLSPQSHGAQEELVEKNRWEFSLLLLRTGGPKPRPPAGSAEGMEGGVAGSIFFFDAYRFARSLYERLCLFCLPPLPSSLLYLLVPRSEGFLFLSLPFSASSFFCTLQWFLFREASLRLLHSAKRKKVLSHRIYRKGYLPCHRRGIRIGPTGGGKDGQTGPRDVWEGGPDQRSGSEGRQKRWASVRCYHRPPRTSCLVPASPCP